MLDFNAGTKFIAENKDIIRTMKGFLRTDSPSNIADQIKTIADVYLQAEKNLPETHFPDIAVRTEWLKMQFKALKDTGKWNDFKGVVNQMRETGRDRFGNPFGSPSEGGYFNTGILKDAYEMAKQPMAIPALGGALGTGALMAGAAGGMLGGVAVWGTQQYLKTKIMQEQARQALKEANAQEILFHQNNPTFNL